MHEEQIRKMIYRVLSITHRVPNQYIFHSIAKSDKCTFSAITLHVFLWISPLFLQVIGMSACANIDTKCTATHADQKMNRQVYKHYML